VWQSVAFCCRLGFKKEEMGKDLAILLAWPETVCRQAGGWYDSVMKFIGVNKKGYYKVGHSAIVLVNSESGMCHYFDFGRYNTPAGVGRVRDAKSDKGLEICTRIAFNEAGEPLNMHELLEELERNEACNGTGYMTAGSVMVDFQMAYTRAKMLQKKVHIPYGPFDLNGTNCSRFTREVAVNAMAWSFKKIALKFPLTVSPTPLGNVLTANQITRVPGEEQIVYRRNVA
jgi:hypothetical protein